MKNFYKNLAWAIVALFVASAVFSMFGTKKEKPQELSLSEIAAKIIAGEVRGIRVEGEKLVITLLDEKMATSKKEEEAGITQTFSNLGVSSEALHGVRIEVKEESGVRFWAGVLLPTLLPLFIILFVFWLMFRQARGGMNQAFMFGRSNIRLYNPSGKQKITFKDVAGLKESKEELMEVVEFLKNPKKFLTLGAKIPRGVLLVGLPGTGKTLLARATAGEAGVPFFHVSASEFVEMFVGVGAARIRDAFQVAKRAAPAILFIDEIDAVGRQRGAGLGGGNDEREQTLNQILVELDGFERDTRVIVLAATNRPDVLDPALLRPGRFDRRIILDMPDINDREEILKIHARGKTLAENLDLRKVAVRTPGFSGADLANLMNEGAILGARRGKKAVELSDLFDAIEKVMLGPERRSKVISEGEKKITAYHEGGHALVATGIKGADPVHKISIVSRGLAGGYTMKLPLEERNLKTRHQFLADIAVSLGGFIAEKLTFGDVSTGASNDLKVASEIARKLVTHYGMSEKLGPQTFGDTQEMVFLGREITTEKNYSEHTAQQIDAEVREFITHAYQAAEAVLKKNKKALEAIARMLLEKETIEQEEFQKMLKPFRIKPIAVA